MPNTSSERAFGRRHAAPTAAGAGVPASESPVRHFRSVVRAAFETLRPYQWLKNALVFVPLAAAHRLGDWVLLGTAARAWLAFTLCASSIYILNDLRDAGDDRVHPHKRTRPIASGRLPAPIAVCLAFLLLLGTLIVVKPLGLRTAAVLGLYFALMIAYSLWLKAIVLLDALVLASGYALRVLAGGFAVAIHPSARLLAFCIFLFFSLALVKRYAELALLRPRDGRATHARAYLLEDQECIMALGCSSGILSVLVLVLYLSTGNVERLYHRSEVIWFTAILLLYWISHMWLTAHRARMTDDPLVFALTDRLSRVLVLLMAATAWLAV